MPCRWRRCARPDSLDSVGGAFRRTTRMHRSCLADCVDADTSLGDHFQIGLLVFTARGRSTLTETPWPRLDRTVSFPPVSRARARVLINPRAGVRLKLRQPALIIGAAREREILQMLTEGLTAKEIPGRLSLSVYTGDAHRSRIMKELGVRTGGDLIRVTMRKGRFSSRHKRMTSPFPILQFRLSTAEPFAAIGPAPRGRARPAPQGCMCSESRPSWHSRS